MFSTTPGPLGPQFLQYRSLFRICHLAEDPTAFFQERLADEQSCVISQQPGD